MDLVDQHGGVIGIGGGEFDDVAIVVDDFHAIGTGVLAGDQHAADERAEQCDEDEDHPSADVIDPMGERGEEATDGGEDDGNHEDGHPPLQMKMHFASAAKGYGEIAVVVEFERRGVFCRCRLETDAADVRELDLGGSESSPRRGAGLWGQAAWEDRMLLLACLGISCFHECRRCAGREVRQGGKRRVGVDSLAKHSANEPDDDGREEKEGKDCDLGGDRAVESESGGVIELGGDDRRCDYAGHDKQGDQHPPAAILPAAVHFDQVLVHPMTFRTGHHFRLAGEAFVEVSAGGFFGSFACPALREKKRRRSLADADAGEFVEKGAGAFLAGDRLESLAGDVDRDFLADVHVNGRSFGCGRNIIDRTAGGNSVGGERGI